VQQPVYPDETALQEVVSGLAVAPPLVTPWEVERLRRKLADAAEGRRFLLQGGDCAERFEECRPELIANRLKVLLQMSLVLIYGMHTPVVRVGPMARRVAARARILQRGLRVVDASVMPRVPCAKAM